jgi:MIP family channel proteins
MKDDTFRTYVRPVLAEFIGSIFFIFISCGAATTIGQTFAQQGAKTIAIAFAFGFTLFAIAFMIGHISGGHLNFALTLAFVFTGKLPPLVGFLYFLAQLFGGMIGAALLIVLLPTGYHDANCFAANVLADGVTPAMGFFIEFLLTAFFLLVVGAAVDTAKSNMTLVPLAIGMAVMVCHLLAVPITGTSINPTRSFAAAVAATHVTGNACNNVWKDHWIFWFGPILGAITGLCIFEYLLSERASSGGLIQMYRLQKRRFSWSSGNLNLVGKRDDNIVKRDDPLGKRDDPLGKRDDPKDEVRVNDNDKDNGDIPV